MSAIFVTETGFNKKTLIEIKEELEDAFKLIFGDDIDLDPSGSFGQFIGLLSKREADLWDGAEEIYTSRNVNFATGISLDNILAENTITRLPATETQVNNVLLIGDEGTLIDTGKLARQENALLDYSLDSNVTITKTIARKGKISIDSVTIPSTYTVIIDSISYPYTTVGGNTEIDILNGLKALIDAGTWDGSTNVDTINLQLILEYIDTDFSFDISGDLLIDEIASGGNFTCTITGANTLPANTLNIIVTPVSGWDSVINPDSGITGNDIETDSEARIRRAQSLIRGYATDGAISSALFNNIEGVTYAKVFSNRTDFIDTEGRPPHSFESVVQGGDDNDVANEIWIRQSTGIQSYGNTTIIIIDSEGISQTIEFSRPESVYIHVEVTRTLYNEEIYPVNGDELIKEAIVNWSLDTNNINIGKDVIRQRLAIPIYTVPGIEDIIILIDGTPNPGDTPTYAAQNITINDRELAIFAIDRIEVA